MIHLAKKLIFDDDPLILSIQESYFRSNDCLSIKGCNSFYKNRQNAAVSSGGVVSYVSDIILNEAQE
ncbi:hypothetical protein HHI36_007965, partial [Cryptolaemus montrouzieri]